LKNNFFVTVSKTIKVHYTQNNKPTGDRLLLKVKFSADNLNKDGFVVDFSETNTILDYVKNRLEENSLNQLLSGMFSFEKLLLKTIDLINEKANFNNCKLTAISLEGDDEGYQVELR